MKNTNPLYGNQREKSGSQTFEKYSYQYHWALYRILKEHEERREYAVFVELHEDVVVSSSLDENEATFEFNQIKTNKKNFTETSIKKLKNDSSILGKLINSTTNKNYNDRITDINLVATGGFNKDFRPNGISLENISINDIPIETLNSLSDSILKELSIDYFPINIHLITPKLPDTGFQEFIIGNISEIVLKLYPDSLTQAVSIYRPLIDELYRKGMVTDDFQDWEQALKNKSLTSLTVEKVIQKFTNTKNNNDIKKRLDDILNELKLKTMQKVKYEKSFNKYYLNRIANKTISQLDIKKTIDTNIENCDEEIGKLIELVSIALPDNIKSQFTSDIDIKTAIICEYILKELT